MSESANQYGIGLYDHYEEIPPGMWGYVVDRYEPTLEFGGPYYTRTPEEVALFARREELRELEMNQESAPSSLEKFIAIIGDDGQNSALQAERERIIGADIYMLDIEDGVTATVRDLRLRTIRGQHILTIGVSDVKHFYPGGERLAASSKMLHFNPSKISNYQLGNPGRPYEIMFRYDGEQHFIRRLHRNPEIQEIDIQVRQQRKAESPKFAKAYHDGDFDPRLASFLIRKGS